MKGEKMKISAAPINGYDICPGCETLIGKREDFAKQLGVKVAIRCSFADGCDHKILKIKCEKCGVVNLFRGA